MSIKKQRLELGLSQLQLSLQSQVSRWRIRLWEQDYIELRPDELERITSLLKRRRQERGKVKP